MLGVLGLISGWLLLMPAALLLWVRLGMGYQAWMRPFLDIAASVPMLGFCTVGGVAAIAWSVATLARADREF